MYIVFLTLKISIIINNISNVNVTFNYIYIVLKETERSVDICSPYVGEKPTLLCTL